MKVIGWISAFTFVVILVGTPVATAQTGNSEDFVDDFDYTADLIRRMEAMEEANQRQRDEIDNLRAQLEGDWLTEQRAEDIKSLVYDVLADADSRASGLAGNFTAGWDPGSGFFLADPQGRFLLQIAGQTQFRWIYNYTEDPPPALPGFAPNPTHDNHRQGFENTRTKLTFKGHVFSPDTTFLVRTDITRNEPGLVTGLSFLQDAWVRHYFNDNWSIRFGQFKLPFNREELVSSSKQLAVERSLVNENLNIGRSQGVELAFHKNAWRFNFAFSDGAQENLGSFVFTGAPNPLNSNALIKDVEYAITARAELLVDGTWEIFEDFTSPRGAPSGTLLGLGVHYEILEFPNVTGGIINSSKHPARWLAVTADASFEWGGANAFVSATYHYIDSDLLAGLSKFLGLVGQIGWYITPKVEAFARSELGVFSFSGPGEPLVDLAINTIGINYYIDGHDLKWTTDIGFLTDIIDISWQQDDLTGVRFDTPGVKNQIVFRTQFQLLF